MNIKQIWVMGSASDLNYSKETEEIAYNMGKAVALNWYTLVYWAEKDYDSLSTAAARWAKSVSWLTVWVTYWNNSDIWWEMKKYTDVLICTGMQRWGWREFVLVSSCDVIIAIGWWSWTLNEITIAYQKKIPIVVMKWTWWWSDKLADEYIDDRYICDSSRYICKWASSIEDALNYINLLSQT